MKIRTLLQWVKQHRVISSLIALFAVFLVVSFIGGYFFDWPWTGFSAYTSPSHPTGSDFQRGKTLWDWLQLLIIPLVLAVAVLLFNLATTRTEQKIAAQRYEQDQQIALDKQRQDLLEVYLDRMSELLLKEKLRSSEVDAEVRNVARVRTITALTQLDARRVGYVFAFLREAGLMSTTSNSSVVSLKHAPLHNVKWERANLNEANLSGANLNEANLSGATLFDANLSGAYLNDANLNGAHLNDANLNEANLFGANLREARLSQADLGGATFTQANLSFAYLNLANLSGAVLLEADLSGAYLNLANLSGADLNEAKLERAILKGVTGITVEELERQAASLKGATMPDGSIHA